MPLIAFRSNKTPPQGLLRRPIVLYERDSRWLSERHVVLPEPAAYAAIVSRAPRKHRRSQGPVDVSTTLTVETSHTPMEAGRTTVISCC
jgi:hypothetical protein